MQGPYKKHYAIPLLKSSGLCNSINNLDLNKNHTQTCVHTKKKKRQSSIAPLAPTFWINQIQWYFQHYHHKSKVIKLELHFQILLFLSSFAFLSISFPSTLFEHLTGISYQI